jgi:hypothetical protein
MWAWISFGIGLVLIVGYLLVTVVFAPLGAREHKTEGYRDG